MRCLTCSSHDRAGLVLRLAILLGLAAAWCGWQPRGPGSRPAPYCFTGFVTKEPLHLQRWLAPCASVPFEGRA
jgi:hypothetical protein